MVLEETSLLCPVSSPPSLLVPFLYPYPTSPHTCMVESQGRSPVPLSKQQSTPHQCAATQNPVRRVYRFPFMGVRTGRVVSWLNISNTKCILLCRSIQNILSMKWTNSIHETFRILQETQNLLVSPVSKSNAHCVVLKGNHQDDKEGCMGTLQGPSHGPPLCAEDEGPTQP